MKDFPYINLLNVCVGSRLQKKINPEILLYNTHTLPYLLTIFCIFTGTNKICTFFIYFVYGILMLKQPEIISMFCMWFLMMNRLLLFFNLSISCFSYKYKEKYWKPIMQMKRHVIKRRRTTTTRNQLITKRKENYLEIVTNWIKIGLIWIHLHKVVSYVFLIEIPLCRQIVIHCNHLNLNLCVCVCADGKRTKWQVTILSCLRYLFTSDGWMIENSKKKNVDDVVWNYVFMWNELDSWL